VLGRHAGVHHYTIGQRKGLGLAASEPLYVIGLDAARRIVTVGPKSAVGATRLHASRVNWISGAPPDGRVRLDAQIRHRHTPAEAWVEPIGADRAAVEFSVPQPAVTPGQAVVFFRGAEVIGGGWIDS
jgi:tRNA-specific 2-thiouridylase